MFGTLGLAYSLGGAVKGTDPWEMFGFIVFIAATPILFPCVVNVYYSVANTPDTPLVVALRVISFVPAILIVGGFVFLKSRR